MSVVRFIMWLVEAKIFPKLNLLFLVKGHTKNSVDRIFNLLKSPNVVDIFSPMINYIVF